jgi:large conductance mechanosensitive channel
VLAGFKKFLMRGNVVDLAVAFVVGAAFTKVITAVVEGLITPLVSAIFGKPGYGNMTFVVNDATFNYGEVINAAITFLATAAVVYFCIIVPLNHLAERRRQHLGLTEKAAEPEETEKILLAEIRDLLQAQGRR